MTFSLGFGLPISLDFINAIISSFYFKLRITINQQSILLSIILIYLYIRVLQLFNRVYTCNVDLIKLKGPLSKMLLIETLQSVT